MSYGQLARFYTPLAASHLLIASSHTVVNAGLARLPDPEVTLGVFAVIKGLFNSLKAADLVSRQTVLALVDDPVSYRKVLGFISLLTLALFALLATLAFTPAGVFVLTRFVGLSGPLELKLAGIAMRLGCFITFSESLRNSVQGLAVGVRTTGILTVASFVRVALVAGATFLVVRTGALPGITLGMLSWVLGILAEAILVGGYLTVRFGSLRQVVAVLPSRSRVPLRYRDILRFFVPLGIMISLEAWLQPVVQAGITRGPQVIHSLAAYAVAFGIATMFRGPLSLLHECSLVFASGPEDPNWPRVQRFCIGIGIALGAALLLLAVSAAGTWLIQDAIGVSAEVGASAQASLIAFSPVAPLLAWREAHWGLLMRARTTGIIGRAKVVNLLVTAAVMVAGMLLVNQAALALSSPTVAGAAISAGTAAEAAIVAAYNHRRWRRSRT